MELSTIIQRVTQVYMKIIVYLKVGASIIARYQIEIKIEF